MDQTTPASALYGVMAEFEDPTSLVEAARRTYNEGYRRFEAYSPYPIHEVFDAMHIRDKRVSLVVLLGGLTGMFAGIGLQAWVSAIAYPLNIAGRPYLSWPMFVPVTFETTILCACLVAFFGVLLANGLPRLAHPIFDAPDFELASRNRFFLVLRTDDPAFDTARASALLDATNPLRRAEVRR